MVSKLPDEFFRRRPEQPPVAEESDDVVETPAREPTDSVLPAKLVLMPTRMALVVVLVALVIGFFVGRMLLGQPEQVARPSPAPTESVTPTSSPSPSPTEDLGIYDGATVAVEPVEGTTTCEDDGGLQMLGVDTSSSWRCTGDGVGERVTFTFAPGQELVGMRIVGGDNANLDRFIAERRILSIRWHFSDGSWFDQGLPPNDATAQEVAFPMVRAESVELEILDSTLPGDPDANNTDIVTISQLQFLAPAD
ncbi:MAG: hypothetical protein GX596_07370 [Propionibacterium sp.]|nr:hypothetical protein [Propionibacterium sp.]